MIALGRISQRTLGTPPEINMSEDPVICVEGNKYTRLGCPA